MQEYLVFLFVTVIMILLGYSTRKKGFYNLTIKREVVKRTIVEGEEVKFNIVIENKKWLPISFLHIEETFPIHLPRVLENATFSNNDKLLVYNDRYNVLWYERIKRSYNVKGTKRGTYLVKDIKVSIGDVFGFSFETKDIENYIEVVVYPQLMDINKLDFESTSIQGESIVKRWIYKDPLYIKGIREYNNEDRMKDIHWKTSLKMGKLMVKDFDYTSEKEMIFIINSQCGEPYWATMNRETIDDAIKIGVSLAANAQKQGFSVGMWSNAQIISYDGDGRGEVLPSVNNLKGVLELGARIDYATRTEFCKYLEERVKDFKPDATYIIITSFLDNISESILKRIRKSGPIIKVIDVSKSGDIPSIDGIDKILYKGERA